MPLSYLLVFLYILLIGLGLLNSSNHVLKSAVCCFFAMGIIAIYLYLEHSFTNLTSYVAFRAFFYYRLLEFFQRRSISQYDGQFVAGGIYLLIVFVVLYLILYCILTLFSFGDAPRKSAANLRRKAVYLLLYYACWGFAMTFIISMASPAFSNNSIGFLSPLINSLKWEVVP